MYAYLYMCNILYLCFQLELGANRAYGFRYGVYCSLGYSVSAVKDQAKYMCRNGNGNATPRPDTTTMSSAVTFGAGMHYIGTCIKK